MLKSVVMLVTTGFAVGMVVGCGSFGDGGSSPDGGVGNSSGGPGGAGGVGASGPSTPMPDAGSYTCPTEKLSRTIGARRIAVPSITWNGAGYTIFMDEVVNDETFEMQLSFEKTDASGRLIEGPTPLSTSDGTSRFRPRPSFSGWEYGVTYIEGLQDRRAKFMRLSPTLTRIEGSEITLDPSTSRVTTTAVAWSNGMWGVTYANGVGVSFERFNAQGKSLGLATPIGAPSFSGIGTPLVATKTGWALVSTGDDASLFEIDATGTVTNTVPLGIPAARASIAVDGELYAVAFERFDHAGTTFTRVAVGGGIIAGSTLDFGTKPVASGPYPQAPDLATLPGNGGFLLAWAESVDETPLPLNYATIPTRGGPIAGVPFSARTGARVPALAVGPCGWAAVYGTSSETPLASLDVMP